MKKTQLLEKFRRIITSNGFSPSIEDLEEFDREFSIIVEMSDLEQIRVVEMLAKQMLSTKEPNRDTTHNFNFSIWGSTDGIHWFRLGSESLKLPHTFSDKENPDKLPESFFTKFFSRYRRNHCEQI